MVRRICDDRPRAAVDGGCRVCRANSFRASHAAGRETAMTKRIGVIGAGIVGVCAASWLQRDGHDVFVVEAEEPGRGASFGNAGAFNGSSVTPMSMPGVV